ncbi:MAG: hypothetical protein VZQ84_01520 [Anaerovoracaceae bacterium]|nr:hypothetical protein [Anaerovoracaceae bacterium]
MKEYRRISNFLALVEPDSLKTGIINYSKYEAIYFDTLRDIEEDIRKIHGIFLPIKFYEPYYKPYYNAKYHGQCEVEFVSPKEMEDAAPKEPDYLDEIIEEVHKASRISEKSVEDSRGDTLARQCISNILGSLRDYENNPERDAGNLTGLFKELGERLEGILAEYGRDMDPVLAGAARGVVDKIKKYSPSSKTTVLYLNSKHRLLVCMENIIDGKYPLTDIPNKKRFCAEMLAGYTLYLVDQLSKERGCRRRTLTKSESEKQDRVVCQAIASYMQLKLYLGDPALEKWLIRRAEYFFFPGWGYAGGKIIFDYQKARRCYDDQIVKLVLANYCESREKAYYFITSLDQLIR